MHELSPEDKLRFLQKALATERAGGCRDRAVIGGFVRLAETVDGWSTAGNLTVALKAELRERFRKYGSLSRPAREALLGEVDLLLDQESGLPSSRKQAPDRSLGPERGGRGPRDRQTAGQDGESRRAATADLPPLEQPVTVLKGVQEQRARLLSQLGVRTLGDLVWLLPLRHEDRSSLTPIGEAAAGDTVTLLGTVRNPLESGTGYRQRRLEVLLEDETGQVAAVWFNQPWMSRVLQEGVVGRFHGTLRTRKDGELELTSSEYELLPGVNEESSQTVSKIVPIYPLTAGLHQKTLRRLVKQALLRGLPQFWEVLPSELVRRLDLPPREEALATLHDPGGGLSIEAATRRIAFEELFFLQLAVAVKRRLFKSARTGVKIDASVDTLDSLRHRLPFQLTAAQERAVGDITADLQRQSAMARLLQGDVGAGKTIVALAAAMAAARDGFQTALMAPTEILAGQHHLAINRLCSSLGFTASLLVGSQGKPERRAAVAAVSSGEAAIAIGTHALLEGAVDFKRLGLVVIDEQHRFGVHQRARLKLKGDNPNLLVMTATPIPRSLALTLYGDLDLTVLNEMPPGRQPIETKALEMKKVDLAWERIRKEVSLGRQAYIVCPLVEESEKLEAEAAERTFQTARDHQFPDLRVELLHGRMPGKQKAAVMEKMRTHEADVLVATTVVEVGVDVPNATVMVVLNAERFGLAQLHQLRGRVGRGTAPSYFHPVVGTPSKLARSRMRVLEGSADGFEVARKDLELRGPGEFFGTRQSGILQMRVADLPRDLVLLEQARKEAFACVQGDPELQAPDLLATREELLRLYGEFVHRRH